MEMDYYLFFYISEKYLQFRKKQKHLLRKTLIHPVQVAGSTYCGIAFQTGIVYTSKITLKRIGKILFVSVLGI